MPTVGSSMEFLGCTEPIPGAMFARRAEAGQTSVLTLTE
jgi:hypothetical protein